MPGSIFVGKVLVHTTAHSVGPGNANQSRRRLTSWPISQVRVAAAFEISEQCNRVYAHNFGDAPRTQSIEHVDAALLDSLGADTWLMSPPCQPYTSQGLQKDDADPRARALLHLARVLPQMRHPPGAILLENVNNFQRSQSHRSPSMVKVPLARGGPESIYSRYGTRAFVPPAYFGQSWLYF